MSPSLWWRPWRWRPTTLGVAPAAFALTPTTDEARAGAGLVAFAGRFRELAFVFPNQVRFNSHPIHPDNPAHFTCAP